MDVIPDSVTYAVGKMAGFNVNRFKLESNGASTAGPNSILTFNMPSNAILDMKSLKFHFDISTTSDASSTNAIYAKLPADTSSLIQQVEVYCGGQQISGGFQEFNTVSKVKRIINTSRDRDGSVNGALSHGVISDTDAVESVSVVFKPEIGFLGGELSTRYISTSLTGDITCRLTLASNSVLCYKEAAVTFADNFSDAAARTAALVPTFSVTSLHATVDTVTLGDTYESLLLDRLTREESLKVNFKEYYTFALHGINATAHDVRFALSATSIDALYAVCRHSNYQQAGIKAQTYSGASFSDGKCANAFKFLGFNNSTSAKGSLKYQFSINNVLHPQYQADSLDAIHDLVMLTDELGLGGRGNLISSLPDFYDGKCILPLYLNMPGQPISVQSGYSSRGNNTQMSLHITGQTMPTADAASQTPASISTLVTVETTCQLLISGFKQVAVAY